MAQLKITYEFNPDTYYFITGNGKVKRGNYCRACGAPLRDPVSIKRGYGRRCWKDIPVKIVLDIPAGCPTMREPDSSEAGQNSQQSNSQSVVSVPA